MRMKGSENMEDDTKKLEFMTGIVRLIYQYEGNEAAVKVANHFIILARALIPNFDMEQFLKACGLW